MAPTPKIHDPHYPGFLAESVKIYYLIEKPDLLYCCEAIVMLKWEIPGQNSGIYTQQRIQVYILKVQLNNSKYCYVSLTIQLNISHLFTHNQM